MMARYKFQFLLFNLINLIRCFAAGKKVAFVLYNAPIILQIDK